MALIQGCTDPQAINFDPTANTPCVTTSTVGDTTVDVVNGCCIYSYTTSEGCTDPLSPNFDPNATIDDGSCFQTVPSVVGIMQVGAAPIRIDTLSPNCSFARQSVFEIGINGEVLVNGTPISQDCCNSATLGPRVGTGSFTYSNGNCYYNTQPPTNICPEGGEITCVNINSFNIWDNIYVSEFGQSLQIGNQILWSNLITLINNGGSFATYFDTGGLINQNCCTALGYTYTNGVCVCESVTIVEEKTITCISTIDQVLNLPNEFFTQNFQIIGPSLGLSQVDTNFIVVNINNNNDTNGNGVPDQVEARLLLSNALNATGGFHLGFGVTTNNPSMVSQSDCSKISPTPGYWDGTNCMCNTPVTPPNEITNCNLTDVQVLNSFDAYNNSVQIVVQKGTTTSVSQECCLKLKSENNLPWYWESPYCYASQQTASCLPVTFNLNENEVNVEPCENGVEVYMWVYFGTPQNSCNLPSNEEESLRSFLSLETQTPTQIETSPNIELISNEVVSKNSMSIVIPLNYENNTPTESNGNTTNSNSSSSGLRTSSNNYNEKNNKTFSTEINNPNSELINSENSDNSILNGGLKKVVKKSSTIPSASNGFLSLKLGSDTIKKTPKDDNKNQC